MFKINHSNVKIQKFVTKTLKPSSMQHYFLNIFYSYISAKLHTYDVNSIYINLKIKF